MKRKAFLLFMLTFGLLVFCQSSVLATTAADCSACHGDKVTFSAPKVDKANCKNCHAAYHGGPDYIQTVYGNFLTANSPYLPAANLHNTYHYTDPVGQSSCYKCHGVVNCKACHTAPVPHETHGATAFIPPTYTVADSVAFKAVSNSCWLSQCHNKIGQVKRVNTNDTQLCVNCHPRFGYSAKDSTGHPQTAIDSRHTAPASGTLNFVSGPQTVTCTGCHNSNLGTEHANKGKDCLVCHNPSTPIPASVKTVVLNAKGDQAKRACTLCHFNSNVLIVPNEHATYHIANLTGDMNLTVTGGPHASCDTCHNTASPLVVSATVNNTVYKKSIYELAVTPTKTYSCLGCHNSDNNLVPKHRASLDGDEMELTELHAGCATCHTPNTDFAAKVSTIAESLDNGATSYECIECHTGATLDAGHTGFIDEKCQECHQVILNREHLENPITQVNNADNPLTCSTCHKSTNPEVRLAIAVGNTNCLACHSQAHNFFMAQPLPTDIALYPGYEWSFPQSVDIWANEPWMPAGYEGAKILISNRRTDVNGTAVWAYYKENMAANGWAAPAADPDTATNFFSAEFTKDKNKVTIFFYGGENHTATPVVTTGYRLEVIYK